MRSILILIFLVLINKQYCIGQDSADRNETWTIASIGMGNYIENKTYSTLQDTIINLDTFKTIYRTNDSIFNIDDSEYYCSYRIENRKWYFIPKGKNDEFLLYDFNLGVGDTVLINNPWFIGEKELIAFEIDSINLNDSYHKRIAIGYYHEPSGNPFIIEHWIERLGSTKGLFYSGFTTMDAGYQLLCYHQNNNLIYLNSPSNSCGFITTGLNQKNVDKEIKTYPNPASNTLYIENKMGFNKATIFDISGKTIDALTFDKKENLLKMNITDYPKFFLIKLIGDDFVTVKKIIKK